MAAPAALAIAVVLLLLSDTVRVVVTTWYGSTTYSHGFLIIPISVYLVWRRRAGLAAVEIRPAFSGTVFVSFAAVGWLVGEVTDTPLIAQLSLVALIQGVIFVMYGLSMWRALAFPLLYLYFAVPFGQALVPPLQSITAGLAVAMLEGIGVPVFADGNVISVPTGDFYVAEACSGIRYLFASIAVGALFAGIMYRSWWRRAAFLGMSVLIPVLANGLRAFGIIVIASFTGNEFAAGVDHVIYGWVFFTAVTFLTLAIGASFREAGADGLKLQNGPQHGAGTRRVLVAGLLALAPIGVVKLYSDRIEQSPLLQAAGLPLPPVKLPWHVVEVGQDDAPAPIFAAPDAELHAAFADGRSRVNLHIGYYLKNRRGAQAVTSAHELAGGTPWIGVAKGNATTVIDDRSLSVQYERLLRGNQAQDLWYWYWVDGQFSGSPYFAKILEAKVKFFGGEQRAAILVLGAGSSGSDDEAEDALRRFIAAVPDFSQYLSSLQQRP